MKTLILIVASIVLAAAGTTALAQPVRVVGPQDTTVKPAPEAKPEEPRVEKPAAQENAAAEKEKRAAEDAAKKAAAEKAARVAAEKAAADKAAAEKAQAAQVKVAIRRPAGLSAKLQRENQRRFINNIQDGGTMNMADLIRFSLSNGRIKAEFVGQGVTMNGQQRRYKVEGSNAVWVITAHPAFCSVVRYDFDAAEDDFWQVSLHIQGQQNTLSINGQGNDGCDFWNVSYNQAVNNQVMLYVNGFANNQIRQVLNANAPDLNALRADRPDEFRRYLIPLLRKITGQPVFRPGAGDVYRVFTDIPADPRVISRIEALLPAMIAADADQRQKAAEQLRKLGAPGVLAALRMDPALLTPEQNCRLADLVALHTRVVDDAVAAAKDHNFLLDCCEDEDVTIRKAAKAMLEKLLGKPVTLDLEAPAAKRTPAIDKLRAQLDKQFRKDEPAKPVEQPQPQNGPVPFIGKVRLNVAQ